MSKGAIIGLAVAGVAAVGVVIYVSRKRTPTLPSPKPSAGQQIAGAAITAGIPLVGSVLSYLTRPSTPSSGPVINEGTYYVDTTDTVDVTGNNLTDLNTGQVLSYGTD